MKNRPFLSIICFFLFFVFFYLPNNGYADTTSIDELNEKLEDRKETIIDKALKSRQNSNSEFDEVLEKFNQSRTARNTDIDPESIKSNLKQLFFELSINSRSLIIPAFILTIFINIFLMVIIGSKSLAKRKKYIFGSIWLSIFFLFFLNIPILMLYFQGNPLSNIINPKTISNGLYSFIIFLKRNSITIAAIMLMYGVINKILGQNDIPRKMLGTYLIKSAIVIAIVLQALPIVISFII